MGAPDKSSAVNKSFTGLRLHYKQIPHVSRAAHNFRLQIRL
jgi:hypothetical protein